MTDQRVDYREIKIDSPYEIEHLERLMIIAAPNKHVKLTFTAVIPEDKKDSYIHKSSVRDKIKVEQYKDGAPVRTLFYGIPTLIKVKAQDNTFFLEVEALSYTYDTDIKWKRRSYQEPSMAYDAMIDSVIADYDSPAFFNTAAKGEVIDIFTLQYDETDWEFLKHMASRSDAVLVPEGRHPISHGGSHVNPEDDMIQKYFVTITAMAPVKKIKRTIRKSTGEIVDEEIIEDDDYELVISNWGNRRFIRSLKQMWIAGNNTAITPFLASVSLAYYSVDRITGPTEVVPPRPSGHL